MYAFSLFSENDNCNCIMNSSHNCSDANRDCNTDSLIQTEVSELNVTEDVLEKSPGENVQVHLDVFDERKSSTIAFLKIDYLKDDNETVRISCINGCSHGLFCNHRIVM